MRAWASANGVSSECDEDLAGSLLARLRPGSPRAVVVTKGSLPVCIFTCPANSGAVSSERIAVPPVDGIVDTNGAGDAFVAGFFAHALRIGALQTMEALCGAIGKCAREGNRAAARALRRVGGFPLDA